MQHASKFRMHTQHILTEVWDDGLIAGLPKLQHLEVHGLWYHTVAEEKPGLLNKVLEGLTSLHLRVDALHCSDITSPNLRCLTVILNDRRDDRRLQGAGSSILTVPDEAQPEATDSKQGSV